MIQNILDNDLYKFTQQNAVIQLFPRAQAKYAFVNRGKTQFRSGFAEQLQKLVDKMQYWTFTEDCREFMEKACYFLPPTYFDFLKGYHFNPAEVKIVQNCGDLKISVEGPWYRTILWEVPLMAMISELHFSPSAISWLDVNPRDMEKAQWFAKNQIKFVDFGTRRRFSSLNHDRALRILKCCSEGMLVGTSNVYFAKELGLTPMGTQAHEWYSGISALRGLRYANRFAMEDWVKVYKRQLGIALSDTFGTQAFFNDFDDQFARLFDGVRHDSGDPIEFAGNVIKHYQKLKIDPLSKTIVFSDGLNCEKVLKIHEFCKGKIKDSYGIGTYLTNDVGVQPLNMVIKLVEMDGIPVVKLSEDVSKATGDAKAIEYARWVFGV